MKKYRVSVPNNGYKLHRDCENIAEALECIKATIFPSVDTEGQCAVMATLAKMQKGHLLCYAASRWAVEVIEA